MEVEEITRELQGSQRSHLEEREEQLEHSGTINYGEQKSKVTFTLEEETEIHQQRIRFTNYKKKLTVRIIRRHK